MPSFLSRLLLLLVLGAAISLPAQARILKGDWESAGFPMPPYDPAYDYAYSCHAEITDGTIRKRSETGEESVYRLFAVAKFELTKAKPYRGSEEMKWTWVLENGEEEVVVDQPEDPFRLTGFGAGISMRPDQGDQDRVFLHVHLQLPLENYGINEQGLGSGDRNSEQLRATAKLFAYRLPKASSSLPESVSRKALVDCEKLR